MTRWLRYEDSKRAMPEFKVKEIAGFPSKLTNEASPTVMVGNVPVYVVRRENFNQRKHRVIAVCPICALHLSAGRLQQHLKVHGEMVI